MAEKIIRTPRDFPAVEVLLQSEELAHDLSAIPRPIASEIVKEVVAELKQQLSVTAKSTSHDSLIGAIRERVRDEAAARTTRVINATGIIIHTNLGRAPLSPQMFDEIKKTAIGYGNVEFDLTSGKRGGRGAACERYLAALSGAEAGTVVNNNAAAIFLILNTLANRKKVIISRGELVQIGGGFRIPDILNRSGAKLSEVGTTNITSLADYEQAIDDRTALILKVHQSNFIQSGFTQEVDLKALVALGQKHGLPVVNDLGSGVFVSTREILGYHEPTVQESVRAGAALTCFSGDKMLGGVQAGLIAGQRDIIQKIKKNPIFRTVRVDKLVFAVLERLLAAYLDGTHREEIKLWQVLSRPIPDLRRMAEAIVAKVGSPSDLSIEETAAYVGGGALPEQSLSSIGLVFAPASNANEMMTVFRKSLPPIIGRIENDRFILDLKAVDADDVAILAGAIDQALK
ncbi:MAG: L-seryl-tRNA(Sec) selenium transferase [candidate division Zixibacteria bacterium]|nr:L-seryl-tRNA(Sec) selenium transferase [candidate division Zixibacteria bacterium]